jgi:arylsulfatase A-like enzyme
MNATGDRPNILVFIPHDLGDTLRTLADSPAAGNTLVIFTTSHGAGFPRAKATLYEPGLRIPLIMYWPGRIEGGKVFGELLGNADFTPTMLDLAGVENPDAFHGRSFAGLARGEAYEPPDKQREATRRYRPGGPMHGSVKFRMKTE